VRSPVSDLDGRHQPASQPRLEEHPARLTRSRAIRRPFKPLDRCAISLSPDRRERGESLDADAPLFANPSGRRISKRRVQFAWRTWQKKAGFDRLYPFHCTRHTAVTNVYRASRDLFPAQRFARHVSPLTTTVYTHPSDNDMHLCIRSVRC
jgi:hypothetical protein